MRTRLTLHPSQDGAKQLRVQYGDRLVCVRYRYDEQRKKRLKTVELIVEESDWEPAGGLRAVERLVQMQVAWSEEELRRQVKAAGGRWDPRLRVWELRYERAVTLGLVQRIIDPGRM